MTSHLLFPAVDSCVVSCSRRWIGEVLRTRLGFSGLVFSDDLTMGGVQSAGRIEDRACAALDAGSDMVLVCHDAVAAERVIDALGHRSWSVRASRLARLRGRGRPDRAAMKRGERYASALEAFATVARLATNDDRDEWP